MINGLRLKQVRELLGLTQSELALKLSVAQPTVAYLEGGYLQPSQELLLNICECTGFPQSFFEQAEVIEFPYGSLLYRSRTAIDASEKTRASRYGQFMFEVAEKLSQKLRSRRFTFPKGRVDATTAARVARSAARSAPSGLPCRDCGSPSSPASHTALAAARQLPACDSSAILSMRMIAPLTTVSYRIGRRRTRTWIGFPRRLMASSSISWYGSSPWIRAFAGP